MRSATNKLDAYLVIGNPNTRKASLLRCLSGCYQRSVRDIQPLGGGAAFRLYARSGALQHTRTSAADFIAEVQRMRCSAVLCCLSPDASPDAVDDLPDARAYVAAFEAAGWRIRAIAVLGQNGGGVRCPVLRQFVHSPVAPINLTARAVRAHFGWE